MPSGLSSPEVWLLGSSDYSGALAAYLGLRFAFAHFINAHGGDAVCPGLSQGLSRFVARIHRPTRWFACSRCARKPKLTAQRLAASIDHRRLLMAIGREAPIATVEEAQAYPYTERDRAIIERERARAIIGTPDKVKARLLEIAEAYAADELMVVTITGDYASRLRSYELLATEFGLDPQSQDCRHETGCPGQRTFAGPGPGRDPVHPHHGLHDHDAARPAIDARHADLAVSVRAPGFGLHAYSGGRGTGSGLLHRPLRSPENVAVSLCGLRDFDAAVRHRAGLRYAAGSARVRRRLRRRGGCDSALHHRRRGSRAAPGCRDRHDHVRIRAVFHHRRSDRIGSCRAFLLARTFPVSRRRLDAGPDPDLEDSAHPARPYRRRASRIVPCIR